MAEFGGVTTAVFRRATRFVHVGQEVTDATMGLSEQAGNWGRLA